MKRFLWISLFLCIALTMNAQEEIPDGRDPLWEVYLDSLRNNPVDKHWMEIYLELIDIVKNSEDSPYKADVYPLYKRLSKENLESRLGKKIEKLYFLSQVGDYMPDADLYDSEGRLHHLEDYKGKFLLLDIWQSPIMTNWMLPELREEIAEQYKDSLTIISLYIGTDKQAWMNALQKEGKSGLHLMEINDGASGKDIASRLGSYSYSCVVLISPEGTVLKKGLSEQSKSGVKSFLADCGVKVFNDTLSHKVFIDPKTLCLKSPHLFTMIDSVMILCDSQTDSVFHCFREGKLLSRFGKKGEGEHDFSFPTSIDYFWTGDFLCVFDENKRSIYSLKLSPDGQAEWRKLFSTKEYAHHYVVPVGYNRYLSGGIYPDARLYMLDNRGNVERKYDRFPYRDDAEKNRDRKTLSQAYFSCFPSFSSFKNYLVLANRSSKIIDFYQFIGPELFFKKEVVESYPKKYWDDADGSYLGLDKSIPSAYLSTTATSQYVYLLYSGVSYAENPFLSCNGTTIEVYTWEGVKVRQLQLDIPVSQIVVSEDGQTMYAVAYQPEPEIVQFDLPDD